MHAIRVNFINLHTVLRLQRAACLYSVILQFQEYILTYILLIPEQLGISCP